MIGRQSGDRRPNDDRYPASVCRRLFDKMSSTDRLPIDGRFTPGRPSTDIMMKKSSNIRPIVSRSSGNHRPTLHRWQNLWKSADRSTKLLTWVLRQKSRRPTKTSAKIGADGSRQSADVARFSHFWLTDGRATVGFGNMTLVIKLVAFPVQYL